MMRPTKTLYARRWFVLPRHPFRVHQGRGTKPRRFYGLGVHLPVLALSNREGLAPNGGSFGTGGGIEGVRKA